MKFYACLLLILALSAARGPSNGWTPWMYAPTAISACVIVVFMVIEYRATRGTKR